MKFTHSVIGRNTKENREWLEKLGYKLNIMASNKELLYIYTEDSTFHLINTETLVHVRFQECSIDCTQSDDLFRAVSAIREDSDYMQWFVSNDGSGFNLCTKRLNIYSGILCRKATLEELQEKFKI